MIILALDTTTRGGSVAVVRGGAPPEVLFESTGDPAVTHGQRLPGEVDRALAACGLTAADVGLYAVAAGPGSFTGLRVGIATIQGFAMAHERRVVPVSVLDALARAGAPGTWTAAWMDAHRGQIFAALYDPAGHRLYEPSALTPQDTLAAWRAAAGGEGLPLDRMRFIGDGAERHEPWLRAEGVRHIAPAPALAPVIGRLAADDPGRAVLPHAIVPIYVRRPDAELARERRREP